MVMVCCYSHPQSIQNPELRHEDSQCYKIFTFAVCIIMMTAISLVALTACFVFSVTCWKLTDKIINIIECHSVPTAFIVRILLGTTCIYHAYKSCQK